MSSTPNVVIQSDVDDLCAAVERWWPRRKLTPWQATAIRQKYARHDVRDLAISLANQFADNPDSTKPDWTDVGRRLAKINPRTAGQAKTDELQPTWKTLESWAKDQTTLGRVASDLLACRDDDGDREVMAADLRNWLDWIYRGEPIRVSLSIAELVNANGKTLPSGIQFAAAIPGGAIRDRLAYWLVRVRNLRTFGTATSEHRRLTIDSIRAAQAEVARFDANPPSVPAADSARPDVPPGSENRTDANLTRFNDVLAPDSETPDNLPF